MTSSWPDAAPAARGGVLTREQTDEASVRPVALVDRELRTGGWTRLGGSAVRGDAVTEHTLAGLVAQAQAAAQAQGYATGWAEGRRAADQRAREEEASAAARRQAEEQRREAEHQAALAGLARTALDLQVALEGVCGQVAERATEVAVALTEELVGHELAVAAHPGVDAVRRALALVPGEPAVRLRVSPAEAASAELAAVAGAATVVPDASLQRGDALVETLHGVVDARVSTAMARVREVLGA